MNIAWICSLLPFTPKHLLLNSLCPMRMSNPFISSPLLLSIRAITSFIFSLSSAFPVDSLPSSFLCANPTCTLVFTPPFSASPTARGMVYRGIQSRFWHPFPPHFSNPNLARDQSTLSTGLLDQNDTHSWQLRSLDSSHSKQPTPTTSITHSTA